MARKKHLLEALLQREEATAPAAPPRPEPPRPKSPRTPRGSRRSGEKVLPVPAWLVGAFAVGACAAAVVAYSVGFHQGRGSTGAASPTLGTQARDPARSFPPPQTTGPRPTDVAAPPRGAQEPGFGVQVITYADTPANASLAHEVAAYLGKEGVPDVLPVTEPNSRGVMFIVVYAGRFATQSDPGLDDLVRKIRALPGPSGRDDLPFRTANPRRLPELTTGG